MAFDVRPARGCAPMTQSEPGLRHIAWSHATWRLERVLARFQARPVTRSAA